MGAIRDSIVMDNSCGVELRMDIVEGEWENGLGGKLRTRLDFSESHPRTWLPYTETHWFNTLKEAREVQRDTIPAMHARYLELCRRYRG